MMMKHLVYLGLGTNLGQRRMNLQQAVWDLAETVVIEAISPVYETDPWGPVPQPDYLNLCLAARTAVTPRALLTEVKKLELQLGRRPGARWGARLIDIDLLFYDDLVYEDEKLTLPHPHVDQRAFVLAPLADIAPQLVHPVTGQTVAEMLAAVDAAGIRRLPEPLFAAGSIPLGEGHSG